MSIHRTITALKEAGQDFEFYPTTSEIITALIQDIKFMSGSINAAKYTRKTGLESILDIGAGNGKVLTAIKSAGENESGENYEKRLKDITKFYAIEKSPILCGRMDDSIFVIGTDFHEQSLISKTASITFSNPPYSEFERWAVKIIRESASAVVYLVIPQRWEGSMEIAEALKFRGVKTHKVGEYDFLESEDRAARAKVHLLRIDFTDTKDTAFESAFKAEFADFISGFESETKNESRKARQDSGDEMVKGENLPAYLVAHYNARMERIRNNYKAASELDPELLATFGIFPHKVMEGLLEKLTGLRTHYWSDLFSRITAITGQLTTGSREKLLATLNANKNVDFTVSNIYAVIVWALKNANRFIGSQLVDVYENMVDTANVKMYASNKRAFVDGWRYMRDEVKNSHYALEYRIVTHRVGGIAREYHDYKYRSQGITDRAGDFLSDLLTVAQTLGFTPTETVMESGEWKSGAAKDFGFADPVTGNRQVLVSVRAFQNGNLHLKFNSKFMLALNVEHGRLKGWLKTPAEAAEELKDPAAAPLFNSAFKLPVSNPQNLLA